MAKHPSRPANPQPQQAHGGGNSVVHTAQQWHGPLPPPASLEHFERVIPGGAQRILAMAENEQAHRIAAEQKMVASEINATTRGQWLGGIVAIGAIVGAIATAFAGSPWPVPVALVSVPVLGMVGWIVSGRRQ